MDPTTGRFTQEDTYQGNLYDPATLHKYSYANDNPVVYCDPSGYFGAFVGAAVILIATCLNNMSSIIYAGLLAANISAISAFALGKGDIESAAIIGFLIGAAFASGGFILEALNVMTLLEYGMGLSAVTFSFESAYAIGNFAKGHYKEGALHATFSLVALVDCINLYGSWSNTDIASDGNISGYANSVKDRGVFGESGSARNKLALGLSENLDSFASSNGASTWKDFPDTTNWKNGVLDALYDPNTDIIVNLDGIDNPLLASQRAASGYGGATDWELLQIKLTPESWDRITWFLDGEIVPYPF